MFKGRRVTPAALVLSGVLALDGSWAKGQGPTIDTPDTSPGGGISTLGQSPGSGGSGPSSNASDSLLGGRPGPTTLIFHNYGLKI